jgi:hypothetical protein
MERAAFMDLPISMIASEGFGVLPGQHADEYNPPFNSF